MEDVGARVRLFRVKEGYTQESLAAEVGVSRKHVAAIELGKSQPSMELLAKIATALSVSSSDLLKTGAPRRAESFEDRKAHQQLQTILDAGGDKSKAARVVLAALHSELIARGPRQSSKRKAANH